VSSLWVAKTETHQREDWIRKVSGADEKWIASLTLREREVIELICKGLRNKEISDRLHLSMTTISDHLTSIYGKLHVSGRTLLVIYAVKRRLVNL
jgi:DNA-binding NarL/FixJ family response regulator